MTRTKINGVWVYDPIKDLSNGKQTAKIAQQGCNKLELQRDAMAEALASIAQCKNIGQVRKCLEHARQVYPR